MIEGFPITFVADEAAEMTMVPVPEIPVIVRLRLVESSNIAEGLLIGAFVTAMTVEGAAHKKVHIRMTMVLTIDHPWSLAGKKARQDERSCCLTSLFCL